MPHFADGNSVICTFEKPSCDLGDPLISEGNLEYWQRMSLKVDNSLNTSKYHYSLAEMSCEKLVCCRSYPVIC